MVRTLEPFLGEVNELILQMGSRCEAILDKALRALFGRKLVVAVARAIGRRLARPSVRRRRRLGSRLRLAIVTVTEGQDRCGHGE